MHISELWHQGDFDTKNRLQNLVFPDGIMCDKKNDSVRTLYTNALFAAISLLTDILEKKENAHFEGKEHLSNQVVLTEQFSNYFIDDLKLLAAIIGVSNN